MKKSTWKKGLSVTLAAAMTAGLAAGCGSKKEASSGTAEDGKYNLKIMSYDFFGNPMKGDVGAGIMKQVEDYTGTHLDIMWTPKDNYDDKLNLVLAGGGDDMPQIIATDTKSPAIINAARAGALWDVEELMKEFPHLKNAKPEVNDNIRIDGKLYGVYRGRALGRNGLTFRKDWADNLGLRMFTICFMHLHTMIRTETDRMILTVWLCPSQRLPLILSRHGSALPTAGVKRTENWFRSIRQRSIWKH